MPINKVPIITVDGKSIIDKWNKVNESKYAIQDFMKPLPHYYSFYEHTESLFSESLPLNTKAFDKIYYISAPYEEGFYLAHKSRKDMWVVLNKEYLGMMIHSTLPLQKYQEAR